MNKMTLIGIILVITGTLLLSISSKPKLNSCFCEASTQIEDAVTPPNH
eukprot:COSAG01_NODE_14_length_41020_cov_40.702133_41_plen_48_part_00